MAEFVIQGNAVQGLLPIYLGQFDLNNFVVEGRTQVIAKRGLEFGINALKIEIRLLHERSNDQWGLDPAVPLRAIPFGYGALQAIHHLVRLKPRCTPCNELGGVPDL